MNSYPPHRTIEMYGIAAHARGLAVDVRGYPPRSSRRSLFGRGKAANLMNPWRARRYLTEPLRAGRSLILREFLTVPFALWAFLFANWRDRISLVAVHNIQRAFERPYERVVLGHLLRAGFRLLVPESAAGLESLGLIGQRQRVEIVPLGLTEEQAASPTGPKNPRRIVVVGRPREEKELRQTLEVVKSRTRSDGVDCELAFGTSDAALREWAEREGWLVVDTTSELAYRDLLASAGVVIVNYAAEHYRYRTSGVILDAAAARATVVCPDYPVFRDQISRPTGIGLTFRTIDELVSRVTAAMETSGVGSDSFDAYLAARSESGLADTLERIFGAPRRGGQWGAGGHVES